MASGLWFVGDTGLPLRGHCTVPTPHTVALVQCLFPVPAVRNDLNNPAKHAKLDFLNNLATGLIFIIVVVNIFITAFGVQKPVMDVAPRQ